jgi:ribosomal protein S18 acetylase RimI-like enzyme
MSAHLRLATIDDAAAIARILVDSRRAFMPYAPSVHPPPAVYEWVVSQLIPAGNTFVAQVNQEVVAVMAISNDKNYSWIDQLYVLPGHENCGIGTQLLLLAHTKLQETIRLYTFQENLGARRFYERHGYKAIESTNGALNDEKCPDVLYEFVLHSREQSFRK